MQVKYYTVAITCIKCGSQVIGDVELSKSGDFVKSVKKCDKCGGIHMSSKIINENYVTENTCKECDKQPVCKFVEGMYDFLKILHSDSVCVGIGELSRERIDERFLDLLVEVCKYKSGKD